MIPDLAELHGDGSSQKKSNSNHDEPVSEQNDLFTEIKHVSFFFWTYCFGLAGNKVCTGKNDSSL